jgi:hypothetical protein
VPPSPHAPVEITAGSPSNRAETPKAQLVRLDSENGHLVRHTQAVRCEDVVHGGSKVQLRKRAARFLERLYPTPTPRSGSGGDGCPAALRVIGGQVIQSQLVGLIGYSLDSAVASARGSRA